VDHLLRCQPGIPLTNKKRGMEITRLFQVKITPESSDEASIPSTLIDQMITTPENSSIHNTGLKKMLLSGTPYRNDSIEKNRLEGSLLDLIVQMNLPISIVDHPALVKYSCQLNNRFKIPCRQTFTKTIIPKKVIFFILKKSQFNQKNQFNLIGY
jgi:hypothetical protein